MNYKEMKTHLKGKEKKDWKILRGEGYNYDYLSPTFRGYSLFSKSMVWYGFRIVIKGKRNDKKV